jgi:hypothetical protein
MNKKFAAALIWLAPAVLQAQPKPADPNPGAMADYVKVEVRGNLLVARDYKFDPKADPKTVFLGATIPGGSWAAMFELLVTDRKQYDMVKANDRKKVIITGDLESVVLPYDLGHPPSRIPVKYYIRVRDIRLAESK